MRKTLLLLTGFWLVVGQDPVFTSPGITLRPGLGTGIACTVPCTVNLVVKVVPRASNRVLWLLWSNDQDTRNSSMQSLDGEKAQVTYYYQRVLREAGVWEFVAKVERSDSAESDHWSIEVYGG